MKFNKKHARKPKMFKNEWHKFGINPAYKGKFRGKIDLHFHSCYSDGSKDIIFPDIFEIARYYGLSAISLTDHDTIAGVKEFLENAQKYAFPIIPGVEISAFQKDIGDVHLLAYGFDLENKGLQSALGDIQQKFVERFKSLARWVNDNLRNYQLKFRNQISFQKILENEEFAITPEEINKIIQAEQGRLGKSFLAKLLSEKGFFPLKDKEKDREGAPAFRFLKPVTELFPAPTVEIGKAIVLLHSASGLVFMAHPFGSKSPPLTKDSIHYLLNKYPFDGIEVVHSRILNRHEERNVHPEDEKSPIFIRAKKEGKLNVFQLTLQRIQPVKNLATCPPHAGASRRTRHSPGDY